MTREEVVALVREALNEDAATSALVTQPQLETRVNIANRKTWVEAVKAQQGPWTIRSADLTHAASTNSTDYDALSTSGVYMVSDVRLKFGDRWVPLIPRVPQDARDPTISVQPFFPDGYILEGGVLLLDPPPSSDQTIRISYIPNLPILAAGDQVLAGQFPMFHELVAYECIVALLVKDKEDPKGYGALRDELKAEFKKHLSRKNSQAPRAIRHVPYE